MLFWCPLQMEALMLFSQEQERYLLEKQKDQIVIEDLRKNLSQVVPIHFLFWHYFSITMCIFLRLKCYKFLSMVHSYHYQALSLS